MDLLLLTQYFDLLKDVGCNTIYLTHEPKAVEELRAQVHTGLGEFGGKNSRVGGCSTKLKHNYYEISI